MKFFYTEILHEQTADLKLQQQVESTSKLYYRGSHQRQAAAQVNQDDSLARSQSMRRSITLSKVVEEAKGGEARDLTQDEEQKALAKMCQRECSFLVSLFKLVRAEEKKANWCDVRVLGKLYTNTRDKASRGLVWLKGENDALSRIANFFAESYFVKRVAAAQLKRNKGSKMVASLETFFCQMNKKDKLFWFVDIDAKQAEGWLKKADSQKRREGVERSLMGAEEAATREVER